MSNFSEDLKAKLEMGYKLKGSQIQFPVYHLDGVPVEDLNLSVRASNGLKRANIMTADQILGADLDKVRNLGVKSVKEIKNAVLAYSYDNMSDSQKEKFWKEILR